MRKQVRSDNDASEVGILGHFGTFWDNLGHFCTFWDNSEDFLTNWERSDCFPSHFRLFSPIISLLKKRVPDGPTDQRTDGRTDGQTLL